MNRQSSEENSQMIEVDVERCSCSPGMGEMKINTRSHWNGRLEVWVTNARCGQVCRERKTLCAECRMLTGPAGMENILYFS